MRFFFTTPFTSKQDHQSDIDSILTKISTFGDLVTPEDSGLYLDRLSQLQREGLNKNQAHYAFIRQGIASSDAVIIEATEQDLRVGHELSLALIFNKPTLVLSRKQNLAEFITNPLLYGGVYDNIDQALSMVETFVTDEVGYRPAGAMQQLGSTVDSVHAAALSRLRRLAKLDDSKFGEWSRSAVSDPARVADEIIGHLGHLSPKPAWSVFAPIYNADSPDIIQRGLAEFTKQTFDSFGVAPSDLVVEAAAGTGALSRELHRVGFSNLSAFDQSRPMLSEAFKLCAGYPSIDIFESGIAELELDTPAQAIVWTDYSSNFALEDVTLRDWLSALIRNLDDNGLLLFDVRTSVGWEVDFYSEPVTTFASDSFQRIWLNKPDYDAMQISFDVFIRQREADGSWGSWLRETMVERMWKLDEVTEIVQSLPNCELLGIYGDEFNRLEDRANTPNLAYFLLRKSPT